MYLKKIKWFIIIFQYLEYLQWPFGVYLVFRHSHWTRWSQATPVVQMGCLQLLQGRAYGSQPVTGTTVSKSQDHTAKIWELNSMECRGTLAGALQWRFL